VAKAIVQMDKRLRSGEKSVSALEMKLSHLEERLKDWAKDSTRQYRIVLELLNIIRSNVVDRAPSPPSTKQFRNWWTRTGEDREGGVANN